MDTFPPDNQQEPTEPDFVVRTLRGAVLPFAHFYGRGECAPARDDTGGPKLTAEERQTLCDASAKAFAEIPQLLRAWRTTGDFGEPVTRDEQGKWPQPSLGLVGEVLAAFGMIGGDQDARAERRELELARMEVELEKERLAAERERYAFMREMVRSGRTDLLDGGPVEVKTDALVALRAKQTTRKASAPADVNAPVAAPAPAVQTLAYSAPAAPRSQKLAMVQAAPPPAQSVETVAPAAGASGRVEEPESFWSRFKTCMKGAVCDLLLCLLDIFCRDGHFDFEAFGDERMSETLDRLRTCLGDFLCRLLKCVVDALCPPAAAGCVETGTDCHFAVEGA